MSSIQSNDNASASPIVSPSPIAAPTPPPVIEQLPGDAAAAAAIASDSDSSPVKKRKVYSEKTKLEAMRRLIAENKIPEDDAWQAYGIGKRVARKLLTVAQSLASEYKDRLGDITDAVIREKLGIKRRGPIPKNDEETIREFLEENLKDSLRELCVKYYRTFAQKISQTNLYRIAVNQDVWKKMMEARRAERQKPKKPKKPKKRYTKKPKSSAGIAAAAAVTNSSTNNSTTTNRSPQVNNSNDAEDDDDDDEEDDNDRTSITLSSHSSAERKLLPQPKKKSQKRKLPPVEYFDDNDDADDDDNDAANGRDKIDWGLAGAAFSAQKKIRHRRDFKVVEKEDEEDD